MSEVPLIPFWIPIALLAVSVACLVYQRLTRRVVSHHAADSSGVQVAGTLNRDFPAMETGDNWRVSAELQYFQSEIDLGLMYVDISRLTDTREDAKECLRRALTIYVELSGWVQTRGGDESLERRLDRLRWLMAAAGAHEE